MNKTNPVIADFSKLGIINQKNLRLFHNKTRDGFYNVLIDDESGVILLEENTIKQDYYKAPLTSAPFDEFFKKNGFFEDDLRRFKTLRLMIENSQHMVDVGSEWGGFLKLSSSIAKKLNGVELNKEAIEYVSKNLKVKVFEEISQIMEKPDLITLFHVLEHIPNQINFLESLYRKMKSGGMLVIEVPQANDFLIKDVEIPEYRDFIFWNEHLVLHTKESLKILLQSIGFIKVNVTCLQRYGFLNHFGWIYDKKPGGHKRYADRYNEELNNSYCKMLENNNSSDTLFCIAIKP